MACRGVAVVWVWQEAKSSGKLQEAKTQLEKKCEELEWRLSLEKKLRVSRKSLPLRFLFTAYTLLYCSHCRSHSLFLSVPRPSLQVVRTYRFSMKCTLTC